MKNRKYTKEFKSGAVELAQSLGSVSKAAKQLGVSQANIHNWRALAAGGTDLSRSSDATPEQLRAELQRLKAEVAELRTVNHILKKAAAFFSQDSLK